MILNEEVGSVCVGGFASKGHLAVSGDLVNHHDSGTGIGTQ